MVETPEAVVHERDLSIKCVQFAGSEAKPTRVSKPRMHSSEAGWRSSCSRFKHCAMHSAIRSPTLNPIGAIGLRATDDDLSDRSGRAEFDPLYQPRPWPEGC